jgi:hypothetical protein
MGQSKGVILCHHKGCSSMVLSADLSWEILIQLEEKDFMDVSFLYFLLARFLFLGT